MSEKYYLSLQYSAIQKTVLRHDRLWSIAGISNILSWMNELEMPAIAKRRHGTAIVAGGGKFTACFPSEEAAQQAKDECVQLLATTLPMLEFQVTKQIRKGRSFKALQTGEPPRNPAIEELSEQKRKFRGYAVSFNPHLQLCNECGEYPVVKDIKRPNRENPAKQKIVPVCRICDLAFRESKSLSKNSHGDGMQTTLQKVYSDYLSHPDVKAPEQINPAADFNDLFSGNKEEKKRMAVWFSDLNNMNDKVPVWLKQDEETKILETFDQFRATVIKIVVDALTKTFPKPTGEVLPFRLVVVGGDDLCLVMAEQDILSFTANISSALNKSRAALTEDHPLSDAWLIEHGDFKGVTPKPFGFGASFVVTSIHTPFSQIHALGEELMSAAKKQTGRRGNSVNWRIMAEDQPVETDPFAFDRPLFIEDSDAETELSFKKYLNLRKIYKFGIKEPKKQRELSTSHLQQIVGIMMREKDAREIERQLKLLDSGEADKSFSPLLRDPAFRNSDKTLNPRRLATLLELITIAGGDQ